MQSSLKSVLDVLGINVVKTRNYNDQVWINCPFPHRKGRDKYPSMSIKEVDENYLFYCTACKYRGNVYSILKDLRGDNPNLKEKLIALLKKDYTYYLNQDNKPKIPVVNKPSYVQLAKEYYSECIGLPEHAISFYEKKGIPESVLNKANAKYNKIKNRIVFPIYSISKRLIGVQERALSKMDRIKWNILYSFPKNDYLYFLDISNELVFICEGIGDVLALYNYGYSAVSVFGSSISERQIELLSFIGKKYYIFFDGDLAGREGTKQAIAKIGNRLVFSWIFCEDGQDPGSVSKEYIENILRRRNEKNNCNAGS
jgi:DNA primase